MPSTTKTGSKSHLPPSLSTHHPPPTWQPSLAKILEGLEWTASSLALGGTYGHTILLTLGLRRINELTSEKSYKFLCDKVAKNHKRLLRPETQTQLRVGYANYNP